jgi:hypothetical protein
VLISRRRAVTRAAFFAAGLCFVIGGRLFAQAKITVGPNVLVSASSPGWMHGEYTADADPFNANRIMVCSMRFSQQRNQTTSALYISNDGGRSWFLSLEDSATRFTGVWDPACKFGLDNQAFFVNLTRGDTARRDSTHYTNHQYWRMGGDNGMHLHRSMDAGQSWEPPRYLSLIDYETLTIDRTNSRYRARMYIYGNTTGRGVWLVYSTDGGLTWTRSERNDNEDYHPRDGTVLPSGTLLLPFNNQRRGRIAGPSDYNPFFLTVAASRDGGVHIDSSVNIAPAENCRTTGLGFGMASDHSRGPFHGRAYIVWPDQSGGRCRPLVSWSDDEGKTWSSPVVVSDAPPRRVGFRPTGHDHTLPKIAVNPRGVVGVTWYDPAEDTTTSHSHLRFSASLDGGETWLPSVKVSDHGYVVKNPPETPAEARVQGGGKRAEGAPGNEITVSLRQWYGYPGLWALDYTGMAAGADGAFHAFWIDNRSGSGELYTARVTVEGTVAKPETLLASLSDITSALELQFTSSVWDPKTRTIALEYQLLNTSNDTIVGPVKIQVTALTSEVGVPSLWADGKLVGRTGSIVNISRTIPSGGLLPGQTSLPQRLSVKLERAIEVPSVQVDMRVRVYGSRRGAQAAAGRGDQAPS